MYKEFLKRIAFYFDDHLRLLRSLSLNPKFWCVLIIDILLIIASIYLSYTIRFEHTPNGVDSRQIILLIPLLIIVKLICLYLFGLYRGMWRYTSTTDLLNAIKASITAELIVVSWLLYLNRFEGLSRSVFVLDFLFTFLFVTTLRVIIRYYYKSSGRFPNLSPVGEQKSNLKRLMLIGAGDAAESVIRELHDNKTLPYIAVGLVDDNPAKIGMKIHGIPVIGKIDDLAEHAKRVKARELLISISSASGREMQRLVRICQNSGIPFKVLPGLGEIIDGNVSLKTIRDISYMDLLGRKEVRLDQGKIGSYLTDKTVLVTGAGGSIGSELCRQVIRFSPKLIILFDAGEENLYSIQMELHHDYNFTDYVPVLGRVQDLTLLETVFKQYKPSVVFHAAAYKHVPLIEINPWEAVYNNILATQRIIESSIVHGVERFVLVSTDKAVRPTNVMGASKRLTELLMLAHGRNNWDGCLCPNRAKLLSEGGDLNLEEQGSLIHNTIFMAVRFGNVLGSSGSVIPLFQRQIERGGPVTVTHPDITRYFMSIEEATQLILQAGAMGEGEEIFILKMGEPVKIADMAWDLIKLSGRQPDTEIEIKYTGLRQGEKLYEELITEGEGIVDTDHEKIMILHGDRITCADLSPGIVQLQQKSNEHDSSGIKNILQQLIPEYTPYHAEPSANVNNSCK